MEKLTIAQSAPIDMGVSRGLKYAGTERIVDTLNQEYHKLGHSSIVFASGDSDLSGYGTLIVTNPKSLWKTNINGQERTMLRSKDAYETHYKKCLDYVINKNVNILHDHPGQFLVSSNEYYQRKDSLSLPLVTTIHENISQTNLKLATRWRELQNKRYPIYFIAISESHRRKFETEAGIDIPDYVYNGIPLEIFSFKKEKKDYLFWIGRISDIKGTDLAVQVARKTKRPLIIAGEIHDPYKKFYEEKILPFVTKTIQGESYGEQEKNRNDLLAKLDDGEDIVKEGEIFFIGPVDNKQKVILYKNAYATLVPNRWEEPFGLISIESMATGTPAIGTDTGALPEVIADGKSGYIIKPVWIDEQQRIIEEESAIRDLIDTVKKIKEIDPIKCRKHVEKKFSSSLMAKNYIKLYSRLLK